MLSEWFMTRYFIKFVYNKSFQFNKLNYRKFSTLSMKMSSVKIGTHNGIFHCDEVLACCMLKILPEYKDAEIVRTRELSILETCDVVVDVGDIYDPKIHRYDHHMKTFSETISTVLKNPNYNSTIKLSSAGLIYCHFGHRIIKQLFPEITEEDTEAVFTKVYDNLITEIDALDNGVSMTVDEPVYRIVTDLSSRVGKLNPPWNSNLNQTTQFTEALNLVREEFLSFVNDCVHIWLPCKVIVEAAIQNRFQVDSSGEIIKLSQACPWKEHFFAIEKHLNLEPIIKFVIFYNNNYMVQAVPVKPGSFVLRKTLPAKWGGLRNEKLVEVSGIKECVFVHVNLFTGGNKTEEGAMQMAREGLKIE
ncbi:PREDICTED: UPF0160 protein MYG1, mitochondrial [Ceratosolen solmsi marchali]|uniref:UPF0160 protein MYG1, mitochondrial n=1 Tax=Ceratosolen solmsi marchali TaxID=326594 RepID=A0AAJ6YD53_9HYME|nr:PREDICTED: UPF0160 protein MYG1, mitochondrial [Ceratosolen solmsi marchali]